MKRLAYGLLTTFMIQGAGLVTGVVAARLLAPEGRGDLALVLSWVILWAGLGSLSINEAVVYGSSRGKARGQASDVLTAGLMMSGVTALLSVIGAILTARYVLALDEELGARTILLGLVIIPVFQFAMILTAYVQAVGTAFWWSVLRASPALIGLGFAVLFVVSDLGRTVDWYLIAQGTGVIIPVVGICVYLARGSRRVRLPTAARLKSVLLYAVQSHPAAIGAQRENLDRLLISMLVPAAALGQYAVAATLPAALLALAATFDMVLFPRVAREEDPDRAGAMFVRWARAAILFLVVAAAGLAILCAFAIPIAFGEVYRPAVPIAAIMCATYFLIGVRMVIGSGYKAVGRPLRHSRGDILALVISLVLIVPLTSWLGLIGSALAVLGAQLMAIALALMSFRSAIGQPVHLLFLPRKSDLVWAVSQLKSDLRDQHPAGGHPIATEDSI